MKRKKLFLLMIAFLLIGTSRVDVLLCIRYSSGAG